MASAKQNRLLAEIRACRRCLEQPLGRPLPHEPRPVLRISETAKLAIFGQAPGTRVHLSGVPFSDRSGDRLRAWMGVSQAQFYDEALVAIVPMGFCYPGQDAKGGDLPPRPECAPAWRARVLATLPNLQLVLLVGLYAQAWHLPRKVTAGGLTQTVAGWRALLAGGSTPAYLPLPHPSWRNTGWLKANPWFETELLPELKSRVSQLLSR